MYLIRDLTKQAEIRKTIKQLDKGICPGCNKQTITTVRENYLCTSCGYKAHLNYDVKSYLKNPYNNK